ncbi:MAG: diguanylate cyclase [Clostridia bacterium]
MMEIRFEDEEPGERSIAEGLRFARRVYPARIVGLALGFVCIAGTLWELGVPAFEWALLALSTLGWPHLAYWLARRSRNPHRQELRNLMIDSAIGGVWIPAMHFNVGPSLILFTMLAMDKAAVAGLGFMARCIGAQLFAMAVVTLLIGFQPPTEQASIFARTAAVPLLVVYSIIVGLNSYRLARRVRQQAQTLAALSSVDELSGLLTQSHWKRAALGEAHRCRRLGTGASLMMIDIDRFKAINDQHGHPAGDEVIRAVAAMIRDNLRAHDVPGRYGGDEFAVLLPGASEATAQAIAGRLRERMNATTIDAARGIHTTVSIGIAAWQPSDTDAESWIDRADRALYRAKQGGRNRVEQYSAPAEAPPAS